jgi:4-aminobutyrate--pyruvate transaminase
MGKRLHDGLRKFHSVPIVGDIRGLGLMAAIELVRNKETREAFPPEAGVGAQFKRAAFDGGLLIRAIGDNICMSPPLIISTSEIDLMLERLGDALAKTEAWARSQKLM